ncbi:serine protease [Halalkalibacter nanhaiisediminis]|uniref:Serine protease n=1 Tax=Halalkalibacter nanhaiisediminis TaxID=688079 RepID=A0A562QT08_9BACI|nr:serine protease [Halalkalibacter nanhaiisediminis]TWI59226.1 hypothetical protein IQ10_00940 [Halalkalibacter nanhaiisediminis]
MKVGQIEKEIDQLEWNLALLKNRLTMIQQNCNHQFKGDQISQKCVKCNKVNVLYY